MTAHAGTLAPDDWPGAPERRYAEYQVRLADRYDRDVDSRTIDTESADRIHYLVAGDPDGEPVLLLHGITEPAAIWLPMMPPSTRIGAVTPARRSAMPSSRKATPSSSAPERSSSFAVRTSP